MAMMGSNNWDGPDHSLHLGGPEDEFQQFLDMNGMGNMAEGLQFDFSDFQNANGGHMPTSQSRESIDTTMGGTENGAMMPRLDNGMHAQVHNVTTGAPLASIPASMMPPPTPSEAMAEIDAQIQYLQQQRMQQHQRHIEEQHTAFFIRQNHVVPPTPQSLELQAGTQFYSPHDQATQPHAMFDRFSQLKEQHQDMSFTPLVSPAVTPLESQFSIDTQFTVPGAYFSPLTSPALHAQNDTSVMYDHRLSSTNSPTDMELEALPGSAAPTSGDVAKKLKKTSAAKTRKSTVRSSPITKARRKTLTTPIMKSQQALNQVVEDIESREQQLAPLPPPAPQPSSSSAFGGTTDSENGSVSPHNLSDMPPPPVPKPKSARPSPHMGPQNGAAMHSHPILPGQPSPATPASLMKLPSPKANKSSSRATSQEPAANEHIENFELPESVNAGFQKPQPRPLALETRSQTQSPALSPMSAKTPGSHPMTSPAAFSKPTAPGSATASPLLAPGPPSGSLRKTPQMLPRNSKKRGSVSSVHVSPALRPRISPNIKPLLPGGTTAEDTASLLLASKSNYQNILEGNNVPGVSYPSELSTNLTSKRTSHKIAEQGRRNRINSALQEIATLLPASKDSEGEGSDEKKDKDAKNGGGPNGPNSKASTVELAIEYIKQLKQEVEEANRRAEEAEKKLAINASA